MEKSCNKELTSEEHEIAINLEGKEALDFVSNLNWFQFLDYIKTRIYRRWKTEFPQYFVHQNTLDKKVYENSLSGPNRFLLAVYNGLNRTNFQYAGYFIEDYHEFQGYDVNRNRKRLIFDLDRCPDIRIWCMETIEI